jgi:predicted Zn finger-like uncharacterized protein
MRLVCPNCVAQYEIADGAIPDTGRDVQCANCNHIWFQDVAFKLSTEDMADNNTKDRVQPVDAEQKSGFRAGSGSATVFRSHRAAQSQRSRTLDIDGVTRTLPEVGRDIKDILQSEAEFSSRRRAAELASASLAAAPDTLAEPGAAESYAVADPEPEATGDAVLGDSGGDSAFDTGTQADNDTDPVAADFGAPETEDLPTTQSGIPRAPEHRNDDQRQDYTLAEPSWVSGADPGDWRSEPSSDADGIVPPAPEPVPEPPSTKHIPFDIEAFRKQISDQQDKQSDPAEADSTEEVAEADTQGLSLSGLEDQIPEAAAEEPVDIEGLASFDATPEFSAPADAPDEIEAPPVDEVEPASMEPEATGDIQAGDDAADEMETGDNPVDLVDTDLEGPEASTKTDDRPDPDSPAEEVPDQSEPDGALENNEVVSFTRPTPRPQRMAVRDNATVKPPSDQAGDTGEQVAESGDQPDPDAPPTFEIRALRRKLEDLEKTQDDTPAEETPPEAEANPIDAQPEDTASEGAETVQFDTDDTDGPEATDMSGSTEEPTAEAVIEDRSVDLPRVGSARLASGRRMSVRDLDRLAALQAQGVTIATENTETTDSAGEPALQMTPLSGDDDAEAPLDDEDAKSVLQSSPDTDGSDLTEEEATLPPEEPVSVAEPESSPSFEDSVSRDTSEETGEEARKVKADQTGRRFRPMAFDPSPSDSLQTEETASHSEEEMALADISSALESSMAPDSYEDDGEPRLSPPDTAVDSGEMVVQNRRSRRSLVEDRKVLLPDVDELNTSLRMDSREREKNLRASAFEDDANAGRSKFWLGLVTALVLFGVVWVLYLLGPAIVETVPASAPVIDAFRTGVETILDVTSGAWDPVISWLESL